MSHDGQFDRQAHNQVTINKEHNLENVVFLLLSFIENVLLAVAIYAQWEIEEFYSIRVEILLIGFVWFTCNQAINILWLWIGSNNNLLYQGYLSLNETRWLNFLYILVRSFLCIIITSSKNIYDAWTKDLRILPPPNERDIEELNMALRISTAIEYFYEYLEE